MPKQVARYLKRLPHATMIVTLYDDGSLSEYNADNPNDKWGGTWQFGSSGPSTFHLEFDIGPYHATYRDYYSTRCGTAYETGPYGSNAMWMTLIDDWIE